MTGALPLAIADLARHGSYCPKLCTFACPVTEATGRDDAVPWSFHRTVSDLHDERLTATAAAGRLTACSGCLACREPCVFDQDVPAQILAARAVAPPRTEAADAALAALADGRRPDGTRPPRRIGDAGVETVVVAGHADTEATMQAAAALFAAAGRRVAVVTPQGCCGGLARALGAPEVAAALQGALPDLVGEATEVVAMDPHCLDDLRAGLDGCSVIDVTTALAALVDRFHFRPANRTVVWHDPCVLARGEGVVEPPRRLLAAAGFAVVEAEHHGRATACSGAGLGMPLLDEAAATATASRRADELAATAPEAVTSCRRAADALAGAGSIVSELLVLLADQLEDR